MHREDPKHLIAVQPGGGMFSVPQVQTVIPCKEGNQALLRHRKGCERVAYFRTLDLVLVLACHKNKTFYCHLRARTQGWSLLSCCNQGSIMLKSHP